MQGITIIDTIYTYANLISPIWVFIFGFISIVLCFGHVCIKHALSSDILLTCTVVTIMIMLFCGILGCIKTDKVTGIAYYKVSISDDVSLNEFYKTYKILETTDEDNIYYIKELE